MTICGVASDVGGLAAGSCTQIENQAFGFNQGRDGLGREILTVAVVAGVGDRWLVHGL